MPKIRILEMPPGEAPKEVRNEWVGLELPIVDAPRNESGFVTGTDSNPSLNDYFFVDIRTAVAILKQKSPQAAKWWEDNIVGHLCSEICLILEGETKFLMFPKSSAELLPD